MHILLIEPDRLLAATYQTALENAGHSIAHAQSAQQAVYLADEKAPDVIVLEPQLPRHNGIEFLYELKSYTEWQHVPVIVLTVLPPDTIAPFTVLQTQLSVVAVLSKSRTSLEKLCREVARSAPKEKEA